MLVFSKLNYSKLSGQICIGINEINDLSSCWDKSRFQEIIKYGFVSSGIVFVGVAFPSHVTGNYTKIKVKHKIKIRDFGGAEFISGLYFVFGSDHSLKHTHISVKW